MTSDKKAYCSFDDFYSNVEYSSINKFYESYLGVNRKEYFDIVETDDEIYDHKFKNDYTYYL